jgi:hypothetical protein
MIIPKTIKPEMSKHCHDITAFFAGAHVDQLIEIAFEKQPILREAYDQLNLREYMFSFEIFHKPDALIRVHHMLGIFRSAMFVLNEDVEEMNDEHLEACISVYEHIIQEDPHLFAIFDFGWVTTIDFDLFRDEFDAGVLSHNNKLQLKELYKLIIALSIQFINDYEEDYQLTLPDILPTSLN